MQTTVTETVMATLRNEAAAAAKVPITNVAVDYYLECNDVKQSVYDMVCPDGQRYFRYITVKVQDNYKPMFTGQYAGPNSDGSWTLKGDAGIRIQ
jgi:hypothetical protein